MTRFLSLIFLTILIGTPCFTFSQNFLHDSPSHSVEQLMLSAIYDHELRYSIGLSEEEVQQIRAVNAEYNDASRKLRKEFLYPEDYEAEEQRLKDVMHDKLHEIATEEHKENLQHYLETQAALEEMEDEAAGIVRYQSQYFYLNLTDQQAILLNDAMNNLDQELFKSVQYDYETYQEKQLEKILTEEQRAVHTNHKKEAEAAAIAAKIEAEKIQGKKEDLTHTNPPSPPQQKHQRDFDEMLPIIIKLNNLVDNYYIPERAIVRAKLEKELTHSEQQYIEELRVKYAEVWQKYEASDYTSRAMDSEEDEVLMLAEEFELKAQMEFIEPNLNHHEQLAEAVAFDRTTFYDAKALAIRFDEKIDNLQREVDLIFFGMFEQIIPLIPADQLHENERERMHSKIIKKQYQTQEIEYYRNIAFLLVEPADVEEKSNLSAGRSAHSLEVYPIPALETQTLRFEVTTAGKTSIDILSQDGKVLKNIFNGQMETGVQQIEVPVSGIPSDVFYYQISGADGRSVAKSLKGN